jgi:hypothetical protein
MKSKKQKAQGARARKPVARPTKADWKTGLRSTRYATFLKALEDLREKLDDGEAAEVDVGDLVLICRPYEFYKYRTEDLHPAHKQVMELMMKHQKRLDPRVMNGLATYAVGCLNGRYDPSGFTYVAGSLEMAALVEAQTIEEALKHDFPEDAAVFARYAGWMKEVEGSRHVSYWILRKIGKRPELHKRLLYTTLQLEPMFKSFVLHALDEFVGDPGVIGFYKDYIGFFERIRDDPKNKRSEEIQRECAKLLDEARGYLKTVDRKSKSTKKRGVRASR